MKQKNDIIKIINDNIRKNSNFEFIAGLKDMTLSDINCIEEMFSVKSIKPKLTYQIIDNIYIKMDICFN